tara:strand:- start:58 stop:168 length:111 start_codon:yes stop_codon:yes gene_type:complete
VAGDGYTYDIVEDEVEEDIVVDAVDAVDAVEEDIDL